MPVTLRHPLGAPLLPLAALLALLVGLLTLVGAPSAEAATVSTVEKRSARVVKVDRALHVAKRQRGDRYRYGAAGPNAFDCSGLVYFATRRAGFDRVPRTSSQQARYMHRIKRKNMRPGDFVFFTGRSGVYHVGFYGGRRAGRRVIVHAPSPGSRVRTEAIWTNSWFPGTLRRR
ncbi:MAG TPA: NlpC/P60 family protein [Marmoricola sp.]|nr:NlpC/P60 family protein [Marmoricola sp.]